MSNGSSRHPQLQSYSPAAMQNTPLSLSCSIAYALLIFFIQEYSTAPKDINRSFLSSSVTLRRNRKQPLSLAWQIHFCVS